MNTYDCLRLAAMIAAGFIPADSSSALTFNNTGGASETIFAEFAPVEGASFYKVTVSGNGLTDAATDPQLVRFYPSYARVDVPGVPAGEYTLTVDALDAKGKTLDSGTTTSITALPGAREGFAFSGGVVPGAYRADGTLKEGADVLYVTPWNVNTVTMDVVKGPSGSTATCTGLAEILATAGKGFHKSPLVVRIIGCIPDTLVNGLKNSAYLGLQGHDEAERCLENVTIEGVGNDATLYGLGIHLKRTRGIELRNLAIMLQGDDAVSLEMGNANTWIHNCDFFYGRPGQDADQIKGDGSIDIKDRSTDITIDHCHFRDNGKVTGTWGLPKGTAAESLPRVTYHHNWFDHTDSRCPRLLSATAHVYNNYYDGVAVYGIGSTEGSSVFAEGNYFRGVKRPMMISGQGTDTYDSKTKDYTRKGTFSGLDGGIIKAYGNLFDGKKPKLVYQTEAPTQFDAFLVENRSEKVPAEVKTIRGGYGYSNFDTAEGMYPVTPDEVREVPAIVTRNAGRIQGGDFLWNFDNAVDDPRHDLNAELKHALLDYRPTLLNVQSAD